MSRMVFPLEQGWTKGLSIYFEDIKSSARMDLRNFQHVKQVHGTKIVDASRFSASMENAPIEADGLILSSGKIKDCTRFPLIKTADCAPLVFIDRESESVALIHAGWRGLAAGIHRKLFEMGQMDPKSTWVWVGPCLNGEDFEVGEDLLEKFPRYRDRTEVFRPSQSQRKKWYFYTWRFLEEEFGELGVELLYNVEQSTLPSKAFASWRRFSKAGLKKVPQQNYSWVGYKQRD